MIIEDKVDKLIELLEKISVTEILPNFRNLKKESIESKDYESDLVTIVDKTVETYLTKRINILFPDAIVVGEESVSENPNLLDDIQKEELVIIIDPIDGTWNYAKGISLFGVMISIVSKGETIYGIIYDPVNFDYIHAFKNGGAWSGNISQLYKEKHTVSNQKICENMLGFIPYYIFGYVSGIDKRDKLINTFTDFERVMSLRCSAHEYRMLVTGSAEFNLTSNVNLWDHLAGTLIHSEAGGVTRLLTGQKYDITCKKGEILSTNNEETWNKLKEKFKFLEE
jgi:fructose-1,6-bisphosphatase/inositol monophosphatase family enzyme